jgi:TRAP-type mannitol/chloroaromatic compound transport system permease small subunit
MSAFTPHSFAVILQSTSTKIDAMIEQLGRGVAWFSFIMVLLMFAIVMLRYGFSLGWIAMQEAVLYLHAYLFMLGCSYALKHNEHVRVDVFYRNFSPTKQAVVNLFGHLLLLWPVVLFIAVVSIDYVTISWQIKEQSQEAGGLPFVYLLKSLILLMCGTMFLQSFSEVCKNIKTLLVKETK